MNISHSNLASSVDRRRIRSSLSSGSSLGLHLGDIVQRGLVDLVERKSTIPENPPSLAERVFHALADAKIWTSKVAMHLERDARDRYFRQLDLLHDCDEWFDDEQPISLTSYKGFVRFMLTIGGQSKPSLALSPKGNLLAVWQSGQDRLTIEFRSETSAEWVVTKRLISDTERAAGSTILARLRAVLAPYEPEVWFGVV